MVCPVFLQYWHYLEPQTLLINSWEPQQQIRFFHSIYGFKLHRCLVAQPIKCTTVNSGCKNQCGLWLSEMELEFQEVPFRRPTHGLTQTHSLWVPVLGQQLKGHQGHTRRTWTAWHQGKSRRGSFLPDRRAERGHHSFSEPLFTEPEGGHHFCVSINLVITVRPALVNSGTTQAVSSSFSIRMGCLGSCFILS